MGGDSGSPIDLNRTSLSALINQNINLLGAGWLDRRLKKDEQERHMARARNHRKHRVRHQAKHPLVQWYREYQQALAKTNEDQALFESQSALLLAAFLSNLSKAKDCAGMAHILERLIEPDEFLAAAFEVEVAVGYLNQGWQVQFVETSQKRSPDLEITRSDGSRFWAECKRKDEMTERDLENEAFFNNMKDRLYKVWGPTKQNLGLAIQFAKDPQKSELDDICELALEMGRQLTAAEPENRLPIGASMLAGRHRVRLHYLAEPDVVQAYTPIDYGGDHSEFMAEQCATLHTGLLMKNPKVFDFRCDIPADKYQSAINSFKSAVGQIPPSGPSVIWIRVPFPDGYGAQLKDLESMASRIQRELTGEYNRRVNAVVLSARWFSSDPHDGMQAIRYRHDFRVVEHNQPRSPMTA